MDYIHPLMAEYVEKVRPALVKSLARYGHAVGHEQLNELLTNEHGMADLHVTYHCTDNVHRSFEVQWEPGASPLVLHCWHQEIG